MNQRWNGRGKVRPPSVRPSDRREREREKEAERKRNKPKMEWARESRWKLKDDEGKKFRQQGAKGEKRNDDDDDEENR